MRSHDIPSSATIQRWSESAPRFLETTRSARPLGDSRGNHVASSSCSASLPIRMGGFDHSRSTEPGMRSARAVSGSSTRTFASPSSAALAAVRSRARSLISTAMTLAVGARIARSREIGPQPQPRSRKVPVAGGVAPRNSTSVPGSSRSPEKTPLAVQTCTTRPAKVTEI